MLEGSLEISQKELQDAMDCCITQTRTAVEGLGEKFKKCVSENGIYVGTGNYDWTEGFYTGELWLAYEMTGNEKFKDVALKQVDSFLARIQNRVVVDHHDMGFLYSLSCVAAYKLVGSETGKEAALLAADNLMSRFHEKGEFIQAWGELGASDNYRLIIDCLLNLPLLYWATEVTGDEKYQEIATKHIKTCLKYVVREDHSTYHTYYFDKETGEGVRGVTAQGYKNDSAWARGQAWGVYGLALSYKYVKDEYYKVLFRQVTDFFIKHLPEDLVPYWDFDFTYGSTEPRDSSAAAIAVCGMLEMSKYLETEEAAYYTSVAKKILKSLVNNYAVKPPAKSNGQLLHSTYAKQSPYNTVRDNGVDECSVWGDYYYIEAIVRLLKDWQLYW
ncbi:MAG: glycoside hydrolase family 88 protein [Niameybacter sp.]